MKLERIKAGLPGRWLRTASFLAEEMLYRSPDPTALQQRGDDSGASIFPAEFECDD
jgi:hypothetical protein